MVLASRRKRTARAGAGVAAKKPRSDASPSPPRRSTGNIIIGEPCIGYFLFFASFFTVLLCLLLSLSFLMSFADGENFILNEEETEDVDPLITRP